ncbi:MAG: DUF2764 family protein [Chlamydiia bacterium]
MAYYFFDTLLPPLALDREPQLRWSQFCDLAQQNLDRGDWKQFCALRTWIDLQNLRPLWQGQPLQPFGNLDEDGLRTALATGDGLPSMVQDYLMEVRDPKERLDRLPELLSGYLESLALHGTGFLQWMGDFERRVRLVLVALRARARDLDLAVAFQFEDPREPFVAFLVAQQHGDRLMLPLGFEEIGLLWDRYQGDALQLADGLLRFRFQAIEETFRDRRFTIAHILGYAERLVLLEQRAGGDAEMAQQQMQIWLQQAPIANKQLSR